MANVDETDTYKALTDCMTRGAHVELKLRGGETVARFRARDIIAPKELLVRPKISEALVGVV